jgi:menaquinone-dependent protoporphyrinogen oxidase
MNILIFYATVEGQTRKIAEKISRVAEDNGNMVYLADAAQPGLSDPAGYDAAILCAPIHIGKYPASFVHFIRQWKGSLGHVPTALVTVSLAIASKNENERKEAENFPRELEEATGCHANQEHNAAGALKYLEYDFLRRWAMRYISGKEGGPTDTSRDYEMTDWAALEKFTSGFLASLAAQ